MKHRRRAWTRALLVATACSLVAACGPELPPLDDIEAPDLSSVESTVRGQVEDARSRVETSKRRGDLRTVADAYGGLGEIYHAYGLTAAADTAYKNAETLDGAAFPWPYYRALLAQDRGDFETARGHFERALSLRSTSVPTRLRLGEVLLSLGDGDAAAPHFEAAVDRAPGAAAYGLGRIAASTGDLQLAKTELQKAVASAPTSGAAAFALADVKRRLGEETPTAVPGSTPPAFEDPLAERLDGLAISGGALLRRGNQALMAGQLGAAADLFARGVETDPENLELRLNLATAFVRANRLTEAAEGLRQALDDDIGEGPSDRARLHHDLGNVLLASGDADGAVVELERAAELEPDYLDAHFNLANVYGQLERWDDVEKAAGRVVELDAGHARARYLQAMARFNGGRRNVAEAELRQLVAQRPDEPAFREGLAQVLAQTRRTGEAAAVLRLENPAAELDIPTQVRLLRFGAPLLWRRADRNRAIELWRQAAELEPSSQSFTDLANGLQLTGERQEARQLFGRAADLEPQNATAWLSEASLLILEGQLSLASQRLAQAMSHHPQDPGLANVYARLLATAPDPGLRDGRLAVQLARIAYGVELSVEYGETLAMALAEFGNFEQAIGIQRRIAQQAQIAGDRATLRRLVTNLKRYEKRLPVRLAGAE
ncbi:MAG: tetratricopeptide repeat protein [Acidobacteriota bacterium]